MTITENKPESSYLSEEKIGPADLTGWFVAFRNEQLEGVLNPKFKEWLIQQASKWGGLNQIERWLEENDPNTGRPSQIQEMDWSWLPEELRSTTDFDEK